MRMEIGDETRELRLWKGRSAQGDRGLVGTGNSALSRTEERTTSTADKLFMCERVRRR